MTCLYPKSLKNPLYNTSLAKSSTNLPYISVPCGHCYYCRKSKVSEKALIVKHEMSANFQVASFLTLTYNDSHLPRKNLFCNPADGEYFQSYDFDKSDLQLFIKRVRRYIDYHNLGIKFKYLAVGEFGHKYGRCHYHMILIGVAAKVIDPIIDKCWKKGFYKVVDCDDHASYYCTKYMSKSETSVWWSPSSPRHDFNAVLKAMKRQRFSPRPDMQYPRFKRRKIDCYPNPTGEKLCGCCRVLQQMREIVINCSRQTKKIYNNAYRVAFGWSSTGLGKSTCLKYYHQWVSDGYIASYDKDNNLIKRAIPRNYRNYMLKDVKSFLSAQDTSTYSDIFPSNNSWLQSFISDVSSEGFKTYLSSQGKFSLRSDLDYLDFKRTLPNVCINMHFYQDLKSIFLEYRLWCSRFFV